LIKKRIKLRNLCILGREYKRRRIDGLVVAKSRIETERIPIAGYGRLDVGAVLNAYTEYVLGEIMEASKVWPPTLAELYDD